MILKHLVSGNIIEYANRHLGRKVKILTDKPSANVSANTLFDIGCIIGYGLLVNHFDFNKGGVLIALEDSRYGWKQSGGLAKTSGAFSILYEPHYLKDNGKLWFSLPEYLEILKDIVPKTQTNIPYPKTCKLCKAPCCKMGEVLFCSNNRCKTRKTVKQFFIQAKNKYNILTCPECHSSAYTYIPHNVVAMSGYLICVKYHKWSYKLKINDYLDTSLFRKGGFVDMYWNGNRWIISPEQIKIG